MVRSGRTSEVRPLLLRIVLAAIACFESSWVSHLRPLSAYLEPRAYPW